MNKRKAQKRGILSPIQVGWREWVVLPGLGIGAIEAKVDTGARTSALHAFRVEPFDEDGARRVRFSIHPNIGDEATVIDCTADVVDERDVTDSGGNKERRLVIQTPLIIGGRTWPIEMTLTNRDTMRFRMLLGRTAMRDGAIVVDPKRSHLAGVPFGAPDEEEEE